MNSLKNTLTQVQKNEKSSPSEKRLIGGHFSPQVQQQVRMLAAAEDTTIHNLLAEALNDLFEKHGHARIAE
ncbi:hypothetical protein C6499_14575 [Candidatus Poribacteria bacterium]|nr:MAG: hypothetical protein C6499_14575 [Candidatus Poribacteria bacterium]